MSQVEILTSGRRRFLCDVIEVHSGDDLICLVDLGIDGLYKKSRVRLAGVDTPDAYQQSIDTPAGQVRDRVRKLTAGKSCYVDVHSQARGGWVVTLWIEEAGEAEAKWLNLNETLVKEGFVFKGRGRRD